MLSIFRALLRLYPSAYRDEFADEMLAVLHEVHAARGDNCSFADVVFFARETTGLLSGALQEHIRRFFGFFGPSIFPSRRLTMRSEFRFPKATVVLMSLILAAILFAMDQAKAIQASVSAVTPPVVGPIRSANFSLFFPLLLALAAACAVGAIGWAMLFALRRSGIQRLSAFDPSTARPTRR
jgi:hypothetical protein